jgi:hypothetical protein
MLLGLIQHWMWCDAMRWDMMHSCSRGTYVPDIFIFIYLSLACASTVSRYVTVHKGNLVTQTIQSWDSYILSQEAHFESHSSGCVTATGDMSETMRCKFCAISVTAWSDISRDNPICHVAFHLVFAAL